MGKNMQHKDPPNMQLQNGNTGGMNKLFHALNRRHRWQNVRKVLPDQRKGSGKQIIDGETTEPARVPGNRKKNKAQIEQSGTEAGPITTKSSKKFRIRSLIAEEMNKRRGKGKPRRSPSPTRSPIKHPKTPTKVTQNSCESPSTMKKRKCNICAAMLTVSYLRQKAQAYEQKNLGDEDIYSGTNKQHRNVSLMKSFSSPLLVSTKRKDSEIEELKRKLRDCKDRETTKEKFILPMSQWNDTLIPKPMLTRPASFKSPSFRSPSFKSLSSSSQKENKQTSNQSKTLRQKIGKVMKESKESRESRESRKKEKRRILMDAVFHKIPYGRRNSKDPKKLSPEKIKSNSTTSSTGSHRMAADKATLKKTASTGEAMSKYRRLLSQTSTRDDKSHLHDHKPRLCVAGDQLNERTTHLKRVHSVPSISPSDFTQNQEFDPVKTHIETHQNIASEILDDHKSLDNFAFSANLNVPTPAIKKLAMETKLVDKVDENKNPGIGPSSSDHQETINHKNGKDNVIDGNVIVGLNTPDHDEEKINNPKESCAETESDVMKEGVNTSDNHENTDHRNGYSAANGTAAAGQTELVDENLEVGPTTSDHQEEIDDHQKESSSGIEDDAKETNFVKVVNEHLDANLNTSDHEEEIENEIKESSETGLGKVKSFNDILGMFKKVEQKKLEEGIEPISGEPKVVIGCTTVHKNEDADDKDLEVGHNNTLDHLQEERSPLTSDLEFEDSMQDSVLDSPSVIDQIPNSPLEDFYDENQRYMLSVDDQPSTSDDQPPLNDKRPNNNHLMDMSSASTVDDQTPKSGFLRLDFESVKDNTEFQFVKEVLERSGFLKNELLGEWYSSYQPMDPLLFEEVEATFLQTKNLEELDSMKDDEASQKIINDHHLLLFDLINEALLEIHNKMCTFCPNPLIYGAKVRPMPVGYRVLEEVWDIVNMYLSWRPNLDQPSLDDAVSRDLKKGDGWMNLQADAEFVGIELEEMLADDLLDELVFDDLLM